MYRNMLKEFFTEDIKLHTMMNLLYDFLTIKNTNRDEEQNVAQTILYSEQELNDNCRSQLYQVNIIKFFRFLLKKELDMSFNDETQFFNNIDHETLVKKIHFLITKIPNLFKILNYYKSILTNNYLSRNHNVSRISSSQPVNTDKYIFMLLHYAMNDIDDILSNDILSKNYNTTIITTNQYEEYLQYKFTEFLTKELLSKKVIQLEKRPFLSLRRKRKSNAENRTKKNVGTPKSKRSQLPKKKSYSSVRFFSPVNQSFFPPVNPSFFSPVNPPQGPSVSPVGYRPVPVGYRGGSTSGILTSGPGTAFHRYDDDDDDEVTFLFKILGMAINDNDYKYDSIHDELLPGTANEDKAIEQCHAFNFILEKSQFCVSDLDYKIKENQDEMIEKFDDSIMIYDAGAGIIKPLKYDPWLSRQKGQDNSARKYVHPLQHQSYDFVCSRLKNDEPSSKTLSSSFDAATGGTGLGACLRQLMLHFTDNINNQQFENIYQKFYDCLLVFVKSIIEQNNPFMEDGLYDALDILKGIKIVGVMLNGNINCEYKDNIQFKWSSSQSLMAEYINNKTDGSQANPRTNIDITDDFIKNHFLDHLLNREPVVGQSSTTQSVLPEVFHHVCRLMKYMGDKAHIACALFLHLYSKPLPQPIDNSYEKDKKEIRYRPKIIVTNDRLLFKTIAQIMNFDFSNISEINEDNMTKLKDFQNTFGVIHGRVDGKVSKIMQKSNNFPLLDPEDKVFLFLYPEDEINSLKTKLLSLLSIFENYKSLIQEQEIKELQTIIYTTNDKYLLEQMIRLFTRSINSPGTPQQYINYDTLKQYNEDKNEFSHFNSIYDKIIFAQKYNSNDIKRPRRGAKNNQLKFMIPVVNTGTTSTILEDILTGLFSLVECIEIYLERKQNNQPLQATSSQTPRQRYIHFQKHYNTQSRNNDSSIYINNDSSIYINIIDEFYTTLFDGAILTDNPQVEISKKICSQNYFPIPKNNSIIHEYQFNQQDRNRDIYIDEFIKLHELWKKYINLLDKLKQQNDDISIIFIEFRKHDNINIYAHYIFEYLHVEIKKVINKN